MMKSNEQLRAEHRMNLTMCSNVLTGLRKGISVARIKCYTDWFWSQQLSGHFAFEEAVVFPILGNKHPLVKIASAEHRRLRRLFENHRDPYKVLGCIEEELDAHIRFEEKVVFREIALAGKARSAGDFELIWNAQKINPDVKVLPLHPDPWPDEFWK